MTPTCGYLEGVEHHFEIRCGKPAVARYVFPDGHVQYACRVHDRARARRWAAANGVSRELVAA